MALIDITSATGNTLYTHLRNSSGQVWNGSSFVAYNQANWASYSIALTEDGSSGYYKATLPAIPAVKFKAVIYQQSGGSPAATDEVIGEYDNTSLVGMDANIIAIQGSQNAAHFLSESAGTILDAAAVTGTLTASEMTTNRTETLNNVLVGRVVIFTSGLLINGVAVIAAYNGANKKITFLSPMPVAPSNGDTFIIV